MGDWWNDHRNIARLLRFLKDDLDVFAAIRIVEEPWSWTPEYEAMLTTERR